MADRGSTRDSVARRKQAAARRRQSEKSAAHRVADSAADTSEGISAKAAEVKRPVEVGEKAGAELPRGSTVLPRGSRASTIAPNQREMGPAGAEIDDKNCRRSKQDQPRKNSRGQTSS